MKKFLFFMVWGGAAFASLELDTKPLMPLKEASQEIQSAAKAVVLIETPDGAGSGFFISEDGLLLTNRHVVSPEDCAKNGCFITLRREFQSLNQTHSESLYFVTPVVAVPELDIAILQVWNAPPKTREQEPKEKWTPPAFLKMGTHPKLGESIYTVAHPSGGLKRWSEGKYFYNRGDWRGAEILVVPGMSGSPVLNKQGEAIGVWHRSSNDGSSVLRFDQLHNAGYYTDLSALSRFWKKGDPSQDLLEGYIEFPTAKSVSEEDFFEFLSEVEGFSKLSSLMRSRRTQGFHLEKPSKKSKKKEVEKWTIEDVLLSACEEDTENEEFFLDPDYSYPHCEAALNWFDCGANVSETVSIQGVPESGTAYWNFEFCPGKENQEKWQELFLKVEENLELKNQNAIGWISRTAGVFQNSPESANEVVKKKLDAFVKARPESSLIEKAVATAAWSTQLEEEFSTDWTLKKILTDYSQVPGHRLFYEELLQIFEMLLSRKQLTQEQGGVLAKPFFEDPSAPVILKIDLETLLAKTRL